MARQENIPASATVLGLIGTTLWCIQLIPQIWRNWRAKNTQGLSGSMVFCWAVCGPPFGVYAIVQNFNIPLKLQPHIFTGLALIVWGQVMFYSSRMSIMKATISAVAQAVIFACFEAVLVLKLTEPYKRGVSWPLTVIGIIASLALASGLCFPYYELSKPNRHGHVLGIDFTFLGADLAGAFFSLMALVAQTHFDVLGGVHYLVCMSLEVGLFVSQVIWIVRYRKERKQARELGLTFEELMAAVKNDDGRETQMYCCRMRGRQDSGQGGSADRMRSAGGPDGAV